MAWVVLGAAGVVEIAMALALKQAEGWTKLWPSVLGVAAALGSIFLLTHAVRSLPVGTAYAVWTGIGAIGVTLAGIVFFDESSSPARLLCIGAIFAGIAGLHLLDADSSGGGAGGPVPAEPEDLVRNDGFEVRRIAPASGLAERRPPVPCRCVGAAMGVTFLRSAAGGYVVFRSVEHGLGRPSRTGLARR